MPVFAMLLESRTVSHVLRHRLTILGYTVHSPYHMKPRYVYMAAV